MTLAIISSGNEGAIKMKFVCVPTQVSSVELERACVSAVAEVLEAAAVAVPESGGGPDQLVMFVVPSASGIANVKEVQQRCQQAIRNDINPLFKLQKVGLYPVCLVHLM